MAEKSLEELTTLLATYGPLHNNTDLDSAKRAIRAIEIAEYESTHQVDETNYPTLNPLI